MNIRVAIFLLLILIGPQELLTPHTTQTIDCPLTIPKAVDISDLRGYIESYEGSSNRPIDDGQGNSIIGVGFNIPSNAKYFRRLGLSDSPTYITSIQIDSIFKWIMLEWAIPVTKQLIDNLEEHPLQIQYMMIHMTYMLGSEGFKKWGRFRKAIQERNYKLAGTLYKKSNLYKQVSDKTKQYYEVLNSLLLKDKKDIKFAL